MSEFIRAVPWRAGFIPLAAIFIRLYFRNQAAWRGIQVTQAILNAQRAVTRRPTQVRVWFEQPGWAALSVSVVDQDRRESAGPDSVEAGFSAAVHEPEAEGPEELKTVYGAAYPLITRRLRILGLDVGTAHDAFQEAFICCWQSPSVELLSMPARSRNALLTKASFNKYLGVRRKDGVLSSWDPDKIQDLNKGIESHESDIETKVAVISALKKLSMNQRKAILLRHYADFTVSEVAQVMGVSESAVRTHLGRAEKKLRQELADMRPKQWPAFAGRARNSRRKSR